MDDTNKLSFRVGGKYNWKGQSERLVYIGRNWSGNGYWHQFELVGKPGVVWCEVPGSDDLSSFEESTPATPPVALPAVVDAEAQRVRVAKLEVGADGEYGFYDIQRRSIFDLRPPMDGSKANSFDVFIEPKDAKLATHPAPASASEPATIMGVKIVTDPTIPDGEARFMQDGKRVATITGLATASVAGASAEVQAPIPLAPRYTVEMGEAGTAYIAQFKHAHPLPAGFRWEELWATMILAAGCHYPMCDCDGPAVDGGCATPTPTPALQAMTDNERELGLGYEAGASEVSLPSTAESVLDIIAAFHRIDNDELRTEEVKRVLHRYGRSTIAALSKPAVPTGFVCTVDVEKLLCEKIGRGWSAAGMSIASLVDELSKPADAAKTLAFDNGFETGRLAALAKPAGQGDGGVVPEGFWLAPMEPDESMLLAAIQGAVIPAVVGSEQRVMSARLGYFIRMRDSWLSHHPTSGTEGEAR